MFRLVSLQWCCSNKLLYGSTWKLHLIFSFIRQSNKFLLKIVLARGLSFCSFFFGCIDPTYEPSSIRLFIIFITFFPAMGLGIAFVLPLSATAPLIIPVILRKGAWHCFCLFFGSDIPTNYPSYLTDSFFCAYFFVLRFF